MSKAAKKKKGKDKLPKTPEKKVSKIILLEDAVVCLLFFSLTLLFTLKIQVHFTLPKLIALRIDTLFLVLIWIYRLKRGELKSIPRPTFYTIIALSVWWIFSTFFAVHKFTALNGIYGRYNGLWNHETYLLLFIIFSTMPMDLNRIKRMLKLFVLALVPVSVYTLVQFFNLDPMPWPIGRSASTIGNPVILGALLGLSLPFALTFFFEERESLTKICWGFVFFILFSASVSTFSRGPWIGTAIALAIIIVLSIWFKFVDIKRVLILFLCILAVLFALFAYKYKGIENVPDRLKIVGLKTDVGLQTRFLYYRAALSAIKDRPVVGVGFESFRTIYPRYRQPEDNLFFSDIIPTMVHNGYIQTALTNGIPALLLYLALLACIYTMLIKTFIKIHDVKLRCIVGSFMAAITGYLIQDVFGWLEIALTPFFWIILGLSVSLCNTENQRAFLTGWKKMAGYVSVSLCSVILIVLTFDAINILYADRLFWASRTMDLGKDWNRIESNIKEGLENVPKDHYYEDMAGLLYIKKLNESGDGETYQKAAAMFERAHLHNPFDPYVLIHRIDTDTIGIRKGVIKKPSEFTEKVIGTLRAMDKNNATVYESIAKLLITENRFNDALEYLNTAKALKPFEGRYYTLEGFIYRSLNNPAGAMNAYREAVSRLEKSEPLTLEWVNAKQGLAFIYIDKRDFNEALKEIKTVVGRFPNYAHSYIIMGDIYAAMNNFEKARESFSIALKIEPANPYAKRGLEQIEKSR